ncbi:copper transporter [Nakamurella silvestris]|nr:copper transporter [Nakamurella silvestris]
MISMRYHIISLAAVFLALALGIVLGATKASSPLLTSLSGSRDTLTQERDQLKADNEALNRQVASADTIGEAVSEVAVRYLMSDQTVVLITTSDADPADRDAVKSLLAKSGATITAEVNMTEGFTDPARAQELRTLVTSNIPAGKSLPEVTTAGSQVGGLFGILLVSDADGKPQAKDEEFAAALGAFDGAGFLKTSAAPKPGRFVVIVTGAATTGGSEADRAATTADLAAQLKTTAQGVVVAGRQGSDSPTGSVGLIRSDAYASSAVSTVDDVDTGNGRLATVLALAEQRGGGAGRYGVGPNAQAQVPTLRTG